MGVMVNLFNKGFNSLLNSEPFSDTNSLGCGYLNNNVWLNNWITLVDDFYMY